MDLPQLQSVMMKDPRIYREDFLLQLEHFKSELQIFKLNPSSGAKSFSTLINFISTVGHLYPNDVKDFIDEVMNVLDTHATVLEPELRLNMVKALISFSSKKLIQSVVLLPLFFRMFRVHDKELRKVIYVHIVQDIKRHNMNKKNVSLNKTLQNFMYTMLQDESQIAQKKSLDVMIDLYRRGIWKDAKTVNVMAQACLCEGKVVAPALKFFIDPNNLNPEEDEEEDKKKKEKLPIHKRFSHHSKMTKSKKRKIEEAEKEEKSERKKKRELELHNEQDYPAIDMLYDAQGFSEKLLSKLKRAKEPFETRMLMLRLISRCIKRHKLQLEAFYPYLQKYMQPHQEHITLILLSFVEACHELVSPETVEPIVKTIMREFVTDYRPGPLIQLGINTLREMAMRCPLALDQDTVRQLTQFKSFEKDKGVMAAARGVINLFRAINPKVLLKKDRGKDGQMNLAARVPKQFGETQVLKTIPGLPEVLRGDDDDDDDDLEGDDIDFENGEWEVVESEDDIENDATDKNTKQKKRIRANAEDEDSDNVPDLVEAAFPDSVPPTDGEELEDDDEGMDEDVDEDDELLEEDDEMEEVDSNDEELEAIADPNGEEDDDEEEMEEEVDEEEEQKALVEEANMLASQRLMTDEEFKKLDKMKRDKELKRQREVEAQGLRYVGIDPDRDVDVKDLEAWKPKEKNFKDDRVASVLEGREDREGYWERKKREKTSGTTNKDKLKNKPYLMAKQSQRIRFKKSLSMQEKQVLQKLRSLRRKGKRFVRGNGLISNKKLSRMNR